MVRMSLLSLSVILFGIGMLFAQKEQPSPPEMVLIPGGTFEMGMDLQDLPEIMDMGKKVPHMDETHALFWFADETPRHQVQVEPFWMDQHEVTNRQFKAFVQATGYQAEGNWQAFASDDRLDHPVVNVSWNDAAAYAAWAGKRLPTEAEWEFAARGGKKVKWFPWGNEPNPQMANYRFQGETFLAGLIRLAGLRKIATKVVKSYPSNGYGLYDMCGNVWEWCQDDYQPYAGGPVQEGMYKTTENGQPFKVIRGGSWDTPNAVFIRITNRNALAPSQFRWDVGFRCVKSVK